MTGPSATQAETVLNGKLGDLLIARHPRWNEHNVFISWLLLKQCGTIQDVGFPNPGWLFAYGDWVIEL
ncbi:MAG: hypothetical protein F4X16_10820 [Caldilineaceae bacterium SB0661_bin_34]|nr:hypothetical protein [Caldilineaceae bacterium SB0661_bin_34]